MLYIERTFLSKRQTLAKTTKTNKLRPKNKINK